MKKILLLATTVIAAEMGAAGWSASELQAAPLTNGDFEADPTVPVGWTVDGEVQVIALPDDGNRVALIQENTSGAFSRFYQVFELPPNPACLSFRFVMLAPPFECPLDAPTAGGTPPDAFLAFLTTPDTLERLVVPAACEPTFTEAYFWMDNDEQTPPQFCDEENLVGTTPITTTDFATVVLDVSSLTGGQEVRLEFGMADGCDGHNTQIILDDVVIESTGEGVTACAAILGLAVPATSEWGVVVMALLLAVAGARLFRNLKLRTATR